MALHEECGIFGIYDPSGEDRTQEIYCGLIALQHRGQESAGIAMSCNREVDCYKDTGLVSDVFSERVLKSLRGDMGIGHVRYSTSVKGGRENAQPLVTKYKKGTLAVAHNGNIANSANLIREFSDSGAVFYGANDSEVITYLIAKERLSSGSAEQAVANAMPYLKGAYSLLVMSPRKLIAARDPFGFRPLVMGKLQSAILFASETCALDAVGAQYLRDVKPGEIITISADGMKCDEQYCTERPRPCIFEYIYFARPDSVLDGVSVAKAREISGRLLARQDNVEADLVIGVPESGVEAAMGYAAESGIPYGRGFIKNNYLGRTFIRPTQDEREMAVRLKINPLAENVRGKRVIMVDDSIVRGTTSGKIIKLLKNAGAKEVHMRVASPPFLHPCYFGTDVPDRIHLAAVTNTIPEICKMIYADSLSFLSMDQLPELIGSNDYCDGCFSGVYPYDMKEVL